jgi:hypothetical protein
MQWTNRIPRTFITISNIQQVMNPETLHAQHNLVQLSQGILPYQSIAANKK